MSNIFYRAEDILHFVEQLLVERLSDPLGPIADVFGIGGTSDGRRDVRIRAGELERELCDVRASLRAMFGGAASGGFHFFRFLEPFRERRVREQPRAERSG